MKKSGIDHCRRSDGIWTVSVEETHRELLEKYFPDSEANNREAAALRRGTDDGEELAITSGEIEQVASKLHPKKSSGMSGIPSAAIL